VVSAPAQPDKTPKSVEPVPIAPPPLEQRVARNAVFAAPGEKRTRYSLPTHIESASPVGYRTRLSFTLDEVRAALDLLSLERPEPFVAGRADVTEQELFEECALGVLTSRQSTNFRGHRQVTLGPGDSRRVAELMRGMQGLDAPVSDNVLHTHVAFTRPYRTPFTLLLTLVGHKPLLSPFGVAVRAFRKRFFHEDDIPTIGYLQQLHIGILAEAMERAALIASNGQRRAQVFLAPFCGELRKKNRAALRELEELCGLSGAMRSRGWRVALAAQVGAAAPADRIELPPALWRKIGANLLAFRSERIQPGVNHEEHAPPPYKSRQTMDVPDDLTVMAGRAAYNAFAHWTSCDRERSKDLVLLERIDVLTPNGKTRLRQVREELNRVTDYVVKNIPAWADLPTGRAFSRNAERGRKAFALAGQRIYIGGLSRREVEAEGIGWEHAICAFGAAASRAGLVAELMGATAIPAGCDLLAGVCLMAGPVNQNDVGKSFFGQKDLLAQAYAGRDPTSLLVWTLKAKTVADPIGNEEQLMNAARKGALVDLRAAPHEIVAVRRRGRIEPMRRRDGRVNSERAFSDAGNFVAAPDGREVPGNRGSPWPRAWARERVWEE
jgi:hypothetical protein